MSRRSATHAVVSLAALDLRRRPDHASEMRSQLLLGEVVRLLRPSRDRLWWRVENGSDGYLGWVRSWGLIPATRARAQRWERKARARVVEPVLEARAVPGGDLSIGPLFWNARVIAGPRRGGLRRIELPDGRRGWVPSKALGPIGRPDRPLIVRVRGLMGAPYLWGGRTPAGFDCSGFVQQALAEQKVRLPRDAQQQFRACRRLGNGDPAREGDLVFFGPEGKPAAHVGVLLGAGYFAHARGTVRINSVVSGNPLYDRALMAQYLGVRRPR
jgi:cell wall-associated NlpC family hydrolase